MMRLDENLFETLNEESSDRNKVGGKEIAKQQAIKEMANLDFEVGHTFDPDDFDYFKKVCKEDGWNVTEEDFQKYFEYLDEIRANQFNDEEYNDDIDLGDWEEMESKQVEDSDGFMTDYTWYVKDNDDGSETHVMIFGDKDLYTPMNSEPDAEFDSEDVAREWFDNYKGFAEEDLEESLKESKSVTKKDLIYWLHEHEEVALTKEEFDYLVQNLWEAIKREEAMSGEAYRSIEEVDVGELIDGSDNPAHSLGYKLMGLIDEEDLDEDYHKDSFGQSNWYENIDDVMHDYEKGWLTKARAMEICDEEGWEFYDDLDEAVNNADKDYIIEYYDNVPAAERRPSTIDDIEENYHVDVIAFPDDFSACVYALAIHDQENYEFNQQKYLEEFGYADELKTTADVITKLDDIDWGDGSIIICKITQDGRVVYDSGLSKESLLKDIEDENLDESIDNTDEIYNGYVVRKSDTSDNYFVYDNNGHVEDDEYKGQGYTTKEAAIERANSLEKGIAKSNSDLEEAITPNIESEELKALAQKHSIKILDAMNNGDLRMEGAGADLMKFYQEAEQLGLWEVNPELYEALNGTDELNQFMEVSRELGFIGPAQMKHILEAGKKEGKSELETLLWVKETFDGKLPDSLIDGLTDEFLEIAQEIGITDQKSYEQFIANEVEPGETYTQAIRRYKQELLDAGVDLSKLTEGKLDEIAVLNINKPAIFDAIANAKAYISENKFPQAQDALKYAIDLLNIPMTEGAMSNLDLEVREAGSEQNWKDLASKELAEMKDSLHYLRTYAPKEVGAGGNYDSAEDLQADIDALEKDIDELQTKIDYVNSIKRIGQ